MGALDWTVFWPLTLLIKRVSSSYIPTCWPGLPTARSKVLPSALPEEQSQSLE